MTSDTADRLARTVADAVDGLARAVMPAAAPNNDASGGFVSSLTEAVMGVTSGLVQIAEALESVAAAIREKGE